MVLGATLLLLLLLPLLVGGPSPDGPMTAADSLTAKTAHCKLQLLVPFHSAGVNWQAVARFTDVSRSYKVFQNPNRPPSSKARTSREKFFKCLHLPARITHVPQRFWRMLCGNTSGPQLGGDEKPDLKSEKNLLHSMPCKSGCLPDEHMCRLLSSTSYP